VSDPPPNSPHNAETAADTGPRGHLHSLEGGAADWFVFLGRAGPIDIWASSDPRVESFCYAYVNPTGNAHYFDSKWALNPEFIVLQCHRDGLVHLTLHDECIIHQLCAPHNNPNPNGDTQ
jgi:hypothetical protein